MENEADKARMAKTEEKGAKKRSLGSQQFKKEIETAKNGGDKTR